MARRIRDVIALLNRLIQLDDDSIEACKVAIARLRDSDDRKELSALLADHRRHVDDLAFVVRNLGGEPAAHGDLRQVLTKGKIVLGGLTGEHAVLEAMRSDEADVAAAYEQAASQPGIPVDVLKVLERNRDDERNHQHWLAGRLSAGQPVQRGA